MISRKLLRMKELREILPLAPSTIYGRVAAGKFPTPLDLGGNVSVWRIEDIEEWMESLPVAEYRRVAA